MYFVEYVTGFIVTGVIRGGSTRAFRNNSDAKLSPKHFIFLFFRHFALEREYMTCFTKLQVGKSEHCRKTANLSASPVRLLFYREFNDLSGELLSKYVVCHFE